MSSTPILLLAGLILSASSGRAAQDSGSVSVVEEHHPDGALRLRCEVRMQDGSPVREGSYARWHAGGVPAVEGAYASGLPTGPWEAWRADGTLLLEGEFLAGRRSGKWQLHHAGGQLAGVGSYTLGCRDRRWVYFDEAGVKLEAQSGLFRLEKENHAGRVRKHLGETLDEQRHGRWSSWWPNASPQTVGVFEYGLRSGELRFFHMDGTLETEFLSGVYLEGERVADAVAPTGVFRLVEEDELVPAGAPAIDLAGLPRPERAPGVTKADRKAMSAWVQRYREASDDGERRKAELLLVQYGRAVVPELLEELRALDLSTAQDREHGARLSSGVLRSIAHAGFGWNAEPGEADLEANRLTILRWFSWWELVRERKDYWQAVAVAGEGGGPGLLDLRWIDPAVAGVAAVETPQIENEAVPELFEARRKSGANKKTRIDSDAALDWLARHQGPDGGWSAGAFAELCPGQGEARCSGAGADQHDLGVSALALLALMAQGNTRSSGPHAEVVARGLAHLLAAQDPDTGVFGERHVREFLYHHAIATEVLAEAALFANEPAIGEALQRAVDAIEAARNPKGAWRYDLPPIGDNDTSITSWMVTALVAAQRAGARVDPVAYVGARWWLLEATDPETGRIGYDSRGGLSARTVANHSAFPPELSETMTAAGLHAELAMGARKSDRSRLDSARELLYECPPRWLPDGTTNDFYYWFHGSQALRDDRSRAASAWRKALLEALHASQRRDGHAAGSWDPNGPWGEFGGRVYATALGALALQAEWRHAD